MPQSETVNPVEPRLIHQAESDSVDWGPPQPNLLTYLEDVKEPFPLPRPFEFPRNWDVP